MMVPANTNDVLQSVLCGKSNVQGAFQITTTKLISDQKADNDF
jgi:hypothetical protein